MKNYLIILVGFNPLPNYISALYNIEKNSRIFLIYTNEGLNNLGTKVIAKKLKNLINKRFDGLKVHLVGIDKSNPISIDRCIESEVLDYIMSERELWDELKVILDYTGATKMLASKFYCRFKEFESDCCNEKVEVAYSYIDAATAEVRIREGGMEKQCFRDIKIDLNEVLEMHGFKVKENNEDKVVLEYETGEIIKADSLKMNGMFLECTFTSDKKGIEGVKLDLFIYRDYSVRLGGEQAITILKTVLNEKNKKILKRDFDSTVKNYVKNRIEIKTL